MHKLRQKLSLSVSSWFCIPENGMKDMEILCRGSGVIIKSPNIKKVLVIKYNKL